MAVSFGLGFVGAFVAVPAAVVLGTPAVALTVRVFGNEPNKAKAIVAALGAFSGAAILGLYGSSTIGSGARDFLILAFVGAAFGGATAYTHAVLALHDLRAVARHRSKRLTDHGSKRGHSNTDVNDAHQ